MRNFDEQTEKKGFAPPGPEKVLNLAEEYLGAPCTNLFRPLNSYINRVYELLAEDGQQLIMKFYRPGRWSEQALEDEHRFLSLLQDKELPAVAPKTLLHGGTLGKSEEYLFALFPKFGGRSSDEFNDDQWMELGRLLARIHQEGALFKADDRPVMHPQKSTRRQQQFLLQSGLIQAEMTEVFQQVTDEMIELLTKYFEKGEHIYIHGDCHFSNVLQRPDHPLTLIDFDDMVYGPPVQDLWMLLPDVPQRAQAEIELFLEGYETFRSFDLRSLQLIEPLRAMRYVHYMAWCAYQAIEDGNVQVMENFGSREYWQQEIADLKDLMLTIQKEEDPLAFLGGNR